MLECVGSPGYQFFFVIRLLCYLYLNCGNILVCLAIFKVHFYNIYVLGKIEVDKHSFQCCYLPIVQNGNGKETCWKGKLHFYLKQIDC